MANITNQQLPPSPAPEQISKAFNQLVAELIQILQAQQTNNQSPTVTFKEITIRTGPVVADSFPIDLPIATQPSDVHVAQVITGTAIGAVTVTYTILASKKLRIHTITGLASNTLYVIRLSLS